MSESSAICSSAIDPSAKDRKAYDVAVVVPPPAPYAVLEAPLAVGVAGSAGAVEDVSETEGVPLEVDVHLGLRNQK